MALTDSAGLLFRLRADGSQAKAEMKETTGVITGSTGQIGSSLAGLAGPAAIAATVIAGIGIAAVAATQKLFDLAKQAADYGSAIFDATQKTGLGAETMSALKVAAEQSGSSFEGVTNAVAKFNVLLGNAAAGNDKAEKILKTYGITAKDTQGALEQAISTIANMTNASDQAAAAGALFKDRTGEILPVIKSFDGDLPGLIKKLRDLGVLMSDEDAKAADEFGDQMDTLNAQLDAVARTIGFAVMPVFLKWANALSTWLAENKTEIKAWANIVGEAFSLVARLMVRMYDDGRRALSVLQAMAALKAGAGLDVAGAIITGTEAQIQQDILNRNKRIIGAEGGGRARTGTAPPDLEEAEKAAEKLRKQREAARKRELAAQSEQNRKLLDLERDSFDDRQKALEEQFRKREITEKEYREASEANIEAYSVRIKQLLADSFAVDKVDKTSTEIENLELTRKSGLGALDREIARERADVEKNITEITKKEVDERKKIYEKDTEDAIAIGKAKIDTLIAQFEQLKEKGIISEVQYTEAVGALKRQQLEQERALTDDIKKRALIDEQIKQQNIENSIQIQEALKKEAEAYDEYREEVWGAQIAQAEFNARQAELLQQIETAEGTVFGGGFFETLISGWREFYEMIIADAPTIADTLQSMGNIIGGAFEGMANAIGHVVQQWVLTGETGPAVMRKILASALATIAAEAAVRALWELALGFATLFFNPAESVAHFTAAAIFGTIAGVAALAGRAVAGNAFKQQTSQATGRSTGSNNQGSRAEGGAYSGQEDQVIEQGINAPARLGELRIKIDVDDEGMFRVMQNNIRRNGTMRGLILDVQGGA